MRFRYHIIEVQRGNVGNVFDSVTEGPHSISGWAQKFVSIAIRSITASESADQRAGAVDDKDLAVSSDQGNAWLFVHP